MAKRARTNVPEDTDEERCLPWEITLENHAPRDLTLSTDTKGLTVRQPGLYEVSCAVFGGGGDAHLLILVNGRAQLEKRLSAAGESTGCSASDYFALPGDARVGVIFLCDDPGGAESESPLEAFLEVRRLTNIEE